MLVFSYKKATFSLTNEIHRNEDEDMQTKKAVCVSSLLECYITTHDKQACFYFASIMNTNTSPSTRITLLCISGPEYEDANTSHFCINNLIGWELAVLASHRSRRIGVKQSFSLIISSLLECIDTKIRHGRRFLEVIIEVNFAPRLYS